MRIENKVEHLNAFANNAIKSKESNHSFAAMLNQYSNNSQAINQKAEVESLGVFDFSLLLHKNVSKQIKETKEETESKIRQLEKELLQVKQIQVPTRNSPDEPLEILDKAWEIHNAKNSQILKIQKEIAFLNKSAFGYSLDEQGFMGEDFNATAGIPLDYKIHYDTLENIYKKTMLTDSISIPAAYSQVDFMQTAKNAFESFKNFYGEDFTKSNKMLSKEEINALPKGFFTDYGYQNVFALIPTEEMLTQIYSSGSHKLGITMPRFIDFSTKNIENYILPNFIQGDKISLDGMFNEYLSRNFSYFKEAEYSQEWLDYQAYNDKITGRSAMNNTPNNYLIHYDTEQRFWDLLNGKISVESHLQELIDLGYTHNNTIVWDEDREQFANALTHFLKVFQEILDSHSLNVQELQALSKQESYNTQAKQTLQDSKNLKDSKESKDSKPYESQTKQEKMNTFLNHLLKVS